MIATRQTGQFDPLRSQYVSGNIQRQVLYWYDQQGNRYQTSEEQLELAQKQLERYRQQFGELPMYQMLLPHPNPPLIKGREPDFLLFPPFIRGD
ncbi:hypothetical protein [Nostoc sp.]|uniref:hypothetical protein n=1 Tax=Nostoc sp. TaxID=1180 RepID=UPI002FF87AB3